MRRVSLLIVLLAAACLASVAMAQAPTTITYQGRLVNAAEAPITTASSVQFNLYTVLSGGTAIWTETKSITPDAQGLFTVELGLTTALTTSIFDGNKRYLGIKVGSDAEMTPRQLITSVPYAERAAIAGTLPNNTVTTAMIQSNAVTASKTVDEAGFGYGHAAYADYWYSLTSTAAAFASLTITAPAAGYAVVTANAFLGINHVTGSQDQVMYKISTSSGDASGGNFQFAFFRMPAEVPSTAGYFTVPVSWTYTFSVAAGANTFYFNAAETSATGNDRIGNPILHAVYVPTQYSSAKVDEEQVQGGAAMASELPGNP